jgi:hypothetical protein
MFKREAGAGNFCLQTAPFATSIIRRYRGVSSMGFRFRRSVKILPGVKINLSGSGASVSLGGRGFHYTIGPKGTRVTAGIPGTGMSWTEYSPHSKTRPSTAYLLDPSPQFDPIPPSSHVQLEAIENASASEINAHSTSELAPILNSANRTLRIATFILLLSVLLFVGALIQTNQLWLGLSALYATVFVPLAIFLDRYRRSVKVIYDSQGLVARITEALALAFTELSACQVIWSVLGEGSISDWKRNAGASSLVQRNRIGLQFGKPSCIRGRTKLPTFTFGADELYLLPDSALVIVGGAVAAISYRDMDFSDCMVKFREEEQVPSDTTIVDHTWRFVNKSGGPDRRFIGNRQIPVCLYRELGFRSEGGLNCKIQISNPAAADSFYKVIEALRRTTVELPRSITYVQTAKRWPTVVFLSSAILLAAAQLMFLKDGLLKTRISTFDSMNTKQMATTFAQPSGRDMSALPTTGKPPQPNQSLSPPLELKPPVPQPDRQSIADADTDTKEPIDLRDVSNVRWVQSRLRDLGFLRGGGGVNWDANSRSALRDFKATNGIGSDDKWDFMTEELLASGSALRAEQTFVGAWSETTCDARSKPDIVINSRRATSVAGGVCEFLNVKASGPSWSIGTTCSNAGERWSATIHLAVADGKLAWTGRDGTVTEYVRCR